MMWNEADARQKLTDLIQKYDGLRHQNRLAELTERDVIQQYIVPLLRDVLGWPVEDSDRLRYEFNTDVGRPDVVLLPERGGTIYVEAKKFGVIKELPKERRDITKSLRPQQLSEPGMAADRTKEEQQAINYAFENNGTWAILTNFEHLRLYNARRDWLVLAIEEPGAYVTDFDLLRELSYPRVLNGSLDTLSGQRLRADVDVAYLAFITEAREDLARDLLSQRKANPWAFLPDGAPDMLKVREVVQRYLDRMVLIRFAEDHLVIPSGTLALNLEMVERSIYAPSLDSLIDTLFRNFDREHNSALFAPHLTDQAEFSQAALKKLVNQLYGARYRAFSADILGNTYEQYLGKRLVIEGGEVITRDNLETRKKQGSYYTPPVLVRYLIERTVGRALYGTEDGRPDGAPIPGEGRKTAAEIRGLRVLDPACGSGSFLIAAYEVFRAFYEDEVDRLRAQITETRRRVLREGGTPMDAEHAVDALVVELERIEDYPQIILEQHLYGVDLDPQAAELATVNLIMRAMERRGGGEKPALPLILDQNVKVGNSLVGVMPGDPRWKALAPQVAEIARLRRELSRLKPGEDHAAVTDALAAAEAQVSEALAGELTGFTHPSRIRPFHWPAAFPEVFFDADGAPLDDPGFDIVIGNPPWEILKPDLREFYAQWDERIESKLKRAEAEKRIAELDAEDPTRAGLFAMKVADATETAAYSRASTGYSRQGRGDPATHKLFTERAWRLLRNSGRMGLVVPSGIYTDLGTKDLREMLLDEGAVEYILSFSNERYFFTGVHHSFKFCLLGAQKGGASDQFTATFRFNPRVAVAPDEFDAFVRDPANLVTITRRSIERFSPDSLSVMEFQSQRDYAIADKIYGDHPLIGQTVEGAWNLKFTNEFHMTNDRALFNTAGVGLPLYEGKMIHQFDAFFAEPQYWVREDKGRARLENKTGDGYKRARLAFRDITNSTNERTLIAAVLPPNVFVGNTAVIETQVRDKPMLFAQSLINSFCIDFLIRYKVSTHVNMFYLNQIPMPRLNPGDPVFDALVSDAARLTCTRAVYAPLWQDVTGTPWTPESGVTDPAARQVIRDRIDARVAHLFGLSWDEFAHVLGTFPLVFPNTDAGKARMAALHKAYVALA